MEFIVSNPNRPLVIIFMDKEVKLILLVKIFSRRIVFRQHGPHNRSNRRQLFIAFRWLLIIFVCNLCILDAKRRQYINLVD